MVRLTKHTLFLEVTKVMTKVSKEGGCEGVTEWIKPCKPTPHPYSISTTTQVKHHLLGSVAHEKVCYQVTKTRLVNAIKQASPVSQTGCLEGFHPVLNNFSPKMIHYSLPGMYCRYVV